jgi:hypothetical protein
MLFTFQTPLASKIYQDKAGFVQKGFNAFWLPNIPCLQNLLKSLQTGSALKGFGAF